MTTIHIKSKPIDIVPLDTFKVDITFPSRAPSGLPMNSNSATPFLFCTSEEKLYVYCESSWVNLLDGAEIPLYFNSYIEGYISKGPKNCDCRIELLMTAG